MRRCTHVPPCWPATEMQRSDFGQLSSEAKASRNSCVPAFSKYFAHRFPVAWHIAAMHPCSLNYHISPSLNDLIEVGFLTSKFRQPHSRREGMATSKAASDRLTSAPRAQGGTCMPSQRS